MGLEQLEPSAHMFPSDLDKFKKSETFAHAFSVEVGSPEGRSVPLFSLDGRLGNCVKACEGIPNDILESWLNPPEGQFGAPHGTWAQQLAAVGVLMVQMYRERNELLSACKPLLKILRDWEPDHSSGEDRQCIVMATEAITKAEANS
jgi:hypothetical protein